MPTLPNKTCLPNYQNEKKSIPDSETDKIPRVKPKIELKFKQNRKDPKLRYHWKTDLVLLLRQNTTLSNSTNRQSPTRLKWNQGMTIYRQSHHLFCYIPNNYWRSPRERNKNLRSYISREQSKLSINPTAKSTWKQVKN